MNTIACIYELCMKSLFRMPTICWTIKMGTPYTVDILYNSMVKETTVVLENMTDSKKNSIFGTSLALF